MSISSKAYAETKKEAGIEFPTKAISVIVPLAAGGGTDVVGRILGNAMEQFLRQKVVVINKPGGGSRIGIKEAASSNPDGYTLLFNSLPTLILQTNFTKGEIHYNRFILLGIVNFEPFSIMVAKDAPWKTIDEFIKDAKNNPEKIRIGNAGMGASMHITAVLLEKAAGVKFKHIPFKGSHPANTALLGGHIEATTTTIGDALALVKAGKLRPLAVTGEKRMEEYPEIPTCEEKGLKGVIHAAERGLYAPKDVPDPILKILEEAVEKAADSQVYKDSMRKVGQIPSKIVGRAELQELMKKEDIIIKEALEVSGFLV